jgi:hypothetical protein
MPVPPRRRRFVLPVMVLVAAASAAAGSSRAAAAADEVKEPANFVRFTDERGGGRLETAVVTYVNDAGVELKLVSAIHIGERSYFEDLAKEFEARDAVLYELVKEKDAPLPAPGEVRRQAEAGEGRTGEEGGGGMKAVGDLQRFLKDTLNLEFQLDVIDYRKPNFVHADMDREQFEKAQAARGESFETMMLQQLVAAMSKPMPDVLPAGEADADQMLRDLVRLVTRPDMERQIKTVIARQMGQMQDAAMGLDGPGGSVILTERNEAAVKVLAETLKADDKRKISIFYGAAHMPDLAERVRALGFKPAGPIEWKKAWDLTIRADQPSAIEQLFMEALDALDEPAEPVDPEDGVF